MPIEFLRVTFDLLLQSVPGANYGIDPLNKEWSVEE